MKWTSKVDRAISLTNSNPFCITQSVSSNKRRSLNSLYIYHPHSISSGIKACAFPKWWDFAVLKYACFILLCNFCGVKCCFTLKVKFFLLVINVPYQLILKTPIHNKDNTLYIIQEKDDKRSRILIGTGHCILKGNWAKKKPMALFLETLKWLEKNHRWLCTDSRKL